MTDDCLNPDYCGADSDALCAPCDELSLAEQSKRAIILLQGGDLCLYCGNKAYLWSGPTNGGYWIGEPRQAFCGPQCCDKYRNPAGEALIHAE